MMYQKRSMYLLLITVNAKFHVEYVVKNIDGKTFSNMNYLVHLLL